jgi:hypothetical protein
MSNLTDKVSVRLSVILLAIASPFLCIFFKGELNSYSQYWSTDFRPLFIFTNAATSYFLFSSRSWWLPSVFLLILTAFSYDQFYWVHNVSAVIFFLLSGLSIAKSRKFQAYILPYTSSLIVMACYGILWAEITAILTICAFHLHRLIKYSKIGKSRKDFHQSLDT